MRPAEFGGVGGPAGFGNEAGDPAIAGKAFHKKPLKA
jgi:hypothetical protein